MIPAERAHLHVAARSHAGMKRSQNEDRFAVSAYWLDAAQTTPAVFAALADGIGGHQAGEVAAEMAVELVSQTVANSDGLHPLETLRQALQDASQAILTRANSDPTLQGMGATCTCCWIIGDQLYLAYVGDSRAYLVRGEGIFQISKDHTWVQEAIESGLLTPEQARNHPNMHVIRRFLGAVRTTQPDTRLYLMANEGNAQAEANQGLRLAPGDQVLLCSDGLSDLIEGREILTILRGLPPEKAADRLVALSNERGGHDNITLVILQMPGGSGATPGAPATAVMSGWRARRAWFLWGLLGALLVCALAALAVWFFFATL